MKEGYDRRSLVLVALAGASVFGLNTIIARDDEERKRAIENEKKRQEQFIHWGHGRNMVQIENTLFRQIQPFSLGPAFHNANPISFPFDVRIHKGNIRAFRKGISDVLPEASTLELHAEKPETRAVGITQRTEQGLTLSSSFDHRVANHVFTKFLSRNLGNPTVLKEFASAVETDLFQWILNEIHRFQYMSKVGDVFPDPWEAHVAAHEEAQKKAKTLPPPLAIRPITNFNYQQYYETLR